MYIYIYITEVAGFHTRYFRYAIYQLILILLFLSAMTNNGMIKQGLLTITIF